MKALLSFFMLNMLIITLRSSHLTRNDLQLAQSVSSIALSQQTNRKLQEITEENKYALQILGFKWAGLLIYFLGFRIAGMQNLLIWQIVQIYQQNQSQEEQKYFEIGHFIHGYTNPIIFCPQNFEKGVMFEKINLMWEICVVLFLIATVLKHVIVPLYRKRILKMKELEIKRQIEPKPVNPQVKSHEQTQMDLKQSKYTSKSGNTSNIISSNLALNTEQTIKTISKVTDSSFSLSSRKYAEQNSGKSRLKMIKANSLQINDKSKFDKDKNEVKQTKFFMEEGQIQGSPLNVRKVKDGQNTLVLLQFSSNESSPSKQTERKSYIGQCYRKYKNLILYSNIVLKQAVFYIMINSLSIISFSTIKQTQSYSSSSLQNLSFSGCIILTSSVIMFLYTLRLILQKEKGSGQTRGKLRNTTFANKAFWIMTVIERISYSVLIGSGWRYGIAVVCGVKLIVLIVAKFSNIWAKSTDYYRNLVTNFIHLLILIVLVLDQYYFSSTKGNSLSKASISYILISLLGVCFLINFVFFLKDIGAFVWFSKRAQVDPKETRERVSITVEKMKNSREYSENRDTENTRQVKFINQNHLQTSTKTSKMIRKETKPQIQVKGFTPQKHSQIKPALKSQKSFSKISEKKISSNNQTSPTGNPKVRYQNFLLHNTKPCGRFQSKTQKIIVEPFDDALRAQKTHHVIFEEQKEHESDESDDADIVSIKMQEKNVENI